MSTHIALTETMATTVDSDSDQGQSPSGLVYIDERVGGDEWWFAVWYDHAGRLIRRRLGLVSEFGEYLDPDALIPPPEALDAARIAAQEYIGAHTEQLQLKSQASPEAVTTLCHRVAFPRAVVAAEIERICDRIARYDYDQKEPRVGINQPRRPGLQLFADRTKIASRELHRIMEDEERISVGTSLVDKICVEFDLIFEDFIREALAWASRSGKWSERMGTEDSWPFGYLAEKEPEDEELI